MLTILQGMVDPGPQACSGAWDCYRVYVIGLMIVVVLIFAAIEVKNHWDDRKGKPKG